MTIHDEVVAPPASAGRVLPPGFRFHPTDEELIVHYLRRRRSACPAAPPIIAEVDIYKLDPWDLPARAVDGNHSNEWYFFSPRERKYPNGVRPNRAAGSGYWKATGTDKPITSGGQMIGVKKALVFYQGRPPKGIKTSWIMHEYRLVAGNTAASSFNQTHGASIRMDDWVLCRIYKKPEQQLMYMYDDPSSSSSMDVLHGERPMPRPPSISDYLEDYSAVSDLFDGMPAQSSGEHRFFLDVNGGDDHA